MIIYNYQFDIKNSLIQYFICVLVDYNLTLKVY